MLEIAIGLSITVNHVKMNPKPVQLIPFPAGMQGRYAQTTENQHDGTLFPSSDRQKTPRPVLFSRFFLPPNIHF
jgi:hypothetical protein